MGAGAAVLSPEHHDTILIVEGERTHEDVIDDAENGGARTDAQSERSESDRGEGGGSSESAQGVTHILM